MKEAERARAAKGGRPKKEDLATPSPRKTNPLYQRTGRNLFPLNPTPQSGALHCPVCLEVLSFRELLSHADAHNQAHTDQLKLMALEHKRGVWVAP